MKIEPYLFFDGNAEEALAFYERALGGKVEACQLGWQQSFDLWARLLEFAAPQA